ncbi:MAG: site-2 protease family protein [Betaproteobacteria bacterium]|nr:site-2 protease family protein [Betaproteobacteria bacterium]MDE2212206.1 site-2 protease family protein [Betaproteobacteria bacterium]
MAQQRIPLGRILGIPIALDFSWFLVFTLLTWILASSYYPSQFPDWPHGRYWVMGAVTALAFFASVLLHELGHSAVALRYRVQVRRITLHIFGGIAEIADESPSPKAEFLIALAGPAVSLALALASHLLQQWTVAIEALSGLFKYLSYINLSLALFNLLPGYPLDGGRLLRAVLWAFTGNLRGATRVAATAGRGFAFLLILIGAWQTLSGNLGGLWIVFIGWFLDNAAKSQLQEGVFRDLLSGHPVAQVMNPSCPEVPANLPLQQLVDDYILTGHQRCFLVREGNQTTGLVTPQRIRAVPRPEWNHQTAGGIMLPLQETLSIAPDASLWQALQRMDRDGVNQLPVIRQGQVIGMLSREDVISYLRTLADWS